MVTANPSTPSPAPVSPAGPPRQVVIITEAARGLNAASEAITASEEASNRRSSLLQELQNEAGGGLKAQPGTRGDAGAEADVAVVAEDVRQAMSSSLSSWSTLEQLAMPMRTKSNEVKQYALSARTPSPRTPAQEPNSCYSPTVDTGFARCATNGLKES